MMILINFNCMQSIIIGVCIHFIPCCTIILYIHMFFPCTPLHLFFFLLGWDRPPHRYLSKRLLCSVCQRVSCLVNQANHKKGNGTNLLPCTNELSIHPPPLPPLFDFIYSLFLPPTRNKVTVDYLTMYLYYKIIQSMV